MSPSMIHGSTFYVGGETTASMLLFAGALVTLSLSFGPGMVARWFMNLDLAGHTAVVVGGARGIGQAIAVAFAAEKANVAAIDIASEVSAVAKELRDRHRVKALAIVGDVSDLAAMKRAAGD